MKEASSSQNIVRLLENSGISVDMTVPDITKRLRELLVGEWLNNSDRYQPNPNPNPNLPLLDVRVRLPTNIYSANK